MLIFRYRRPHVPGVEDAFWRVSEGDCGRCVIAWIGVASTRWLELADVVICPAQPTTEEAFRQACEVLLSLPGCTVVVAECGGCPILVMRTGDVISFRVPTRRTTRSVEDQALMCYSRLVSPP